MVGATVAVAVAVEKALIDNKSLMILRLGKNFPSLFGGINCKNVDRLNRFKQNKIIIVY